MTAVATILLVEPPGEGATRLSESLSAGGFAVVCAASGPEAALRMREGQFEIVISATELPGFSGYELCRMSRSVPSGREATFLLLCRFEEPDELIRAVGCGADGVLARDSDPGYLLGRIGAVAASKRRRSLDSALSNGAAGPAGGAKVDTRLRDFLLWTSEEIGQGGRRRAKETAAAGRALEPSAAMPGLTAADLEEDRRRAVSQLATGLSHQIANPVSIVVLNHTALRRHANALRDAMAAPREGGAEAALQACRDVLGEIDEIIDDNTEGLARVQATLSELSAFSRRPRRDSSRFDLNEIISSVCHLAGPMIEPRAQLELDLRPIPEIEGDSLRFADALWALLLWVAGRFADSDGQRPRVVVSTRATGDQIVLALQDSGAPIPEEDRRAFGDPFPAHWQRKPHGSGLGLAICRETVARHGGTIRIHGEPGPLNRIEVILPVPDQKESVAKPAEKPRDPGVRRLLMVDDEPNLLKAYRRVLADYEVHTAEGGIAALALLSKDVNFDVLLVDLMMPDLDGKQIYETLTERAPALLPRIIFCSGGIFTRRMESFVQSIANPILMKPVAPDELREAIRRVVPE